MDVITDNVMNQTKKASELHIKRRNYKENVGITYKTSELHIKRRNYI